MRRAPRKGLVSSCVALVCSLLLLFTLCPVRAAHAESSSSSIMCRPDLAGPRREELAQRLREITGWSDLGFGAHGELLIKGEASAGSQSARELLAAAASGSQLLVIEDASNRQDVIFCKVVPGRWTRDAERKPPAFILLVDFADFSHVTGDRAALAAFNVGWGVLHEIAHVVHDSEDAEAAGEVGACEELINRMRRECGLAERAEYFFNRFPGTEQSAFANSFVRLAFEQQTPDTNKKRRYWLVWDSRVVGDSKEHALAAR